MISDISLAFFSLTLFFFFTSEGEKRVGLVRGVFSECLIV